jgi:hypothetical protein
MFIVSFSNDVTRQLKLREFGSKSSSNYRFLAGIIEILVIVKLMYDLLK